MTIENNNINFGGAVFSVAMIEFDNYIQTLNNIEETLKEAIDTMNLIFSQKNGNVDFAECLKKYAFEKFCKAKSYVRDVKKSKFKYKKRLVEFLQENPDKNEEFIQKLSELNNLIEFKEKFLDEQIKKCFIYIQEHINDVHI